MLSVLLVACFVTLHPVGRSFSRLVGWFVGPLLGSGPEGVDDYAFIHMVDFIQVVRQRIWVRSATGNERLFSNNTVQVLMNTMKETFGK